MGLDEFLNIRTPLPNFLTEDVILVNNRPREVLKIQQAELVLMGGIPKELVGWISINGEENVMQKLVNMAETTCALGVKLIQERDRRLKRKLDDM